MKKIAVLIFFLISIISCKSIDNVEPGLVICGMKDPANTVGWYKQILDLQERHNLDSCSIKEYTYRGSPVYVMNNGAAVLRYHFLLQLPQIYNCDGVDIGDTWSENLFSEFYKEAKFVKNIWKKNIRNPSLATDACGSKDPIKDFSFLSKALDFFSVNAWKAAIYEYEYQGSIVFVGMYTYTPNSKVSSFIVIDCQGVRLSEGTNWNQKDFREKAKNLGILYQKL
jgi:hypothetical protein